MQVNLETLSTKFPSNGACLQHLEALRWNGQPLCPHCGSLRHTPLGKESRYHCNGCNLSYSVMVKTVFHNTRVDLRRWFLMISILVNARRVPSARSLAIVIGVNKNTACYMAMRVRHWMLKDREFFLSLADSLTD